MAVNHDGARRKMHRTRVELDLLVQPLGGHRNAVGNGQFCVGREQRLAMHVGDRRPEEPIIGRRSGSSLGSEKQSLEIAIRREHANKM